VRIYSRILDGNTSYFVKKNGKYYIIDNYRIGDKVSSLKEYFGEFDRLPLGGISKPTKIIGLGYNYKDLVGERLQYNEPVVFLKPSSALIHSGEAIIIPKDSKVWTEVELVIIIGKKGKNITYEESHKFIAGYTVGNDITTSNILNRDHHLARSKGLDTFCPLASDFITEIETSNLELVNLINDNVTQISSTRNMIFDCFKIISFLSEFMTLEPGDIIFTGTPANAENSRIIHGDTSKVSIEGIGEVVNPVIEI
jgi:2-keto-4-pentenoate hydratase/2-oxohepta-3-ene-1,7-dioic acid hydratase in catechol pathway